MLLGSHFSMARDTQGLEILQPTLPCQIVETSINQRLEDMLISLKFNPSTSDLYAYIRTTILPGKRSSVGEALVLLL